MPTSPRTRGILLVLLAALIWSSGGVGVKVVDTDPLAIAGWRSFFAAPVLLLAARASEPDFARRAASLAKRRYVWAASVAYAVMIVCFVVAAKKTTAANAIFLQYAGPIYVALLSWPVLGEPLSWKDGVATFASVCGMGLFFAGEMSFAEKGGDLIAVVSGMGFAAMPIFLRLEQRAEHREGAPPEQVASNFSPLMAMVMGNGLAVLFCGRAMVTHPPPTALGWVVIFLLGTVQIGLAYVFYASAVRKLPALESSLLACIEPVLNPLWVVLVVGEVPSRQAVAGGAIIISAVVAKTATSRR